MSPKLRDWQVVEVHHPFDGAVGGELAIVLQQFPLGGGHAELQPRAVAHDVRDWTLSLTRHQGHPTDGGPGLCEIVDHGHDDGAVLERYCRRATPRADNGRGCSARFRWRLGTGLSRERQKRCE